MSIESNTFWRIESLDAVSFVKITKGHIENVFNRAEFSELNLDKVDEVLYLIIYRDKSPRFAVTFGRRGESVSCPFSAPFGYLETLKSNLGVGEYEMAAGVLDTYLSTIGIKKATMGLPPEFYNPRTVNTLLNVLSGSGWRPEWVDLNFALPIQKLRGNYQALIHCNARKNLRIALKSELELRHCDTLEEKIRAYQAIRMNREYKGYPLRMTQEQVLKTMEDVDSDMYLVMCGEDDIAAALVYRVTYRIVQVVYWGDVPGYGEKRPINFLSFELLKLYAELGFEYLDIGPSTELGIPNCGLCDFKDSIGCIRTAKFRMVRYYNE